MLTTKTEPLRINGWLIVAHDLFLGQIGELIADVVKDRLRHPERFKTRRAAKMLAAVVRLAFHDIPADPTSAVFQQGNTLGAPYRHWRRAKFYQQYRMFFRFRASPNGEKVIVFAWVNDEATKQAYDSKMDTYAVFRRMLDSGDPPNDWDHLRAASSQNAKDILTILAEAEMLL